MINHLRALCLIAATTAIGLTGLDAHAQRSGTASRATVTVRAPNSVVAGQMLSATIQLRGMSSGVVQIVARFNGTTQKKTLRGGRAPTTTTLSFRTSASGAQALTVSYVINGKRRSNKTYVVVKSATVAEDTVTFAVPFRTSNLDPNIKAVYVECTVRRDHNSIQTSRSGDYPVGPSRAVSGLATVRVTPSGTPIRFVPMPNDWICKLHGRLHRPGRHDSYTCRPGEIRHDSQGNREHSCDSESSTAGHTMGSL